MVRERERGGVFGRGFERKDGVEGRTEVRGRTASPAIGIFNFPDHRDLLCILHQTDSHAAKISTSPDPLMKSRPSMPSCQTGRRIEFCGCGGCINDLHSPTGSGIHYADHVAGALRRCNKIVQGCSLSFDTVA